MLINSVIIDAILFIKNKLLPRKIPLSFSRIKNLKDIHDCLKTARQRFSITIDDKYTDEYTANHISIRLYFKHTPTKMNLLFIDDYCYYVLKNVKNNIVELLIYNEKKSSIKFEENTFQSDYDEHEINFYINNEQ